MTYFMGIDLGTSSVKAVVSDENGKTYGIGQQEYEVMTPKIGYAQQDVQVWWDSTVRAIRQSIAEAGMEGNQIEGIGFSGQMHGLVALDSEQKPIGPAIIWMDQRSGKEREEILEAAGSLMDEELLNQPGAGMMICSLLWMKRNQPEAYARIDRVMLPKDYIRFRLTGVIGTDYSDASATLAFSVKNRRWCRELISRLGLRDDIWPDVTETTAVVGNVIPEAARETGLSTRTKVTAGGADSAMQLVGNGIVREGVFACNIGTASQVATFLKDPLYDPRMRIQTWCYTVPDTWYIQGGALNGGSTLSWLRGKVLKSDMPFDQMDAEAYAVEPGSEGLLFLPYLAGERTPFQEPDGKGVFYGLSMKHEQAHMVRAVMEGVTYNLRECLNILDELGVRRELLISSGGGARGRTWRQIQADVFDVPVYTTKTREEACMGAVICATAGIGVYGSIEEACESMVKISDTPLLPVRENVKIYREKQQQFLELYDRVKGMFHPAGETE